MQKADQVTKIIAETDALVELIYEYRTLVKSFEWPAVREVVIDRLEGSRRSISGHRLEANVRTSLITAIQHYYSIYGNYGKFKKIEIADKQIKLGKHTIDVSADLIPKTGNNKVSLLIPVKTRETEGGGHSHLFTRDIITAIREIKEEPNNYHIVVIIVAENWSASEIKSITNQIDMIFNYNMNQNQFTGFDEESQVKFNKYIETIIGRSNDKSDGN